MLKYRIISGVLLSAGFLLALAFLPPMGVVVLLSAVCLLAMMEFYAMLDSAAIPNFKVVGTVSGVILVAGTWLAMQCPASQTLRYDVEPILLFGAIAAVLIRQLSHRGTDSPWQTMAGTFVGLFYVAFLFNFLAKILTAFGDTEGRFLLFYLALVVKLTDVGAYFTGSAIGKHKLFPRISPAKTWEGCLGGVLLGMAASWGCCVLAPGISASVGLTPLHALVLAPLLSISGIVGDLIESLMKRAAGVKDSGTMIQGMGGLLDVLDSLLFAAPVLFIYARLFMDNLP